MDISSALVLLQAPAGGSPTGQLVSTLVTFGLVFAIFYFLIIRPQNKKQKEARAMIEAVKKGDKVVTIGGVHGLVHAVEDGTVVIKVDENCKIKFSKSAIASVISKGEAVETVEKPAEEKK